MLVCEQGTREKAHARTELAQNRLAPGGPGANCRAQCRYFRDRGAQQAGSSHRDATLQADLDGTQDRVIFFLIVCFSSLPESLRPDLGFLHRECVYQIFARPGRLQRKKSEMPAQFRHSDIRTTLDVYPQITDPEAGWDGEPRHNPHPRPG